LVLLVALAVHLLTAGLVLMVALIWLTGMSTVLRIVATAVLSGVAWVVAPVHRRRRGQPVDVGAAPALWREIGAIAAALGRPAPTRVELTAELTAGSAGGVRRSVLHLPALRWLMLPPPAAYALLAQAVATAAEAPVDRRWLVTAARASLAEWRFLLLPGSAQPPRTLRTLAGRRPPRTRPPITDLLLPVILAPLTLVVLGLDRLLAAAALRPALLAGYRAVAAATTVTGTDAMLALLRADICLPRTTAELALAKDTPDPDLVAVGRAHLAGVDPRSLEALRTQAGAGPLAPQPGDMPPAVLLEEFVRLLPVSSACRAAPDPSAIERELQPSVSDLEARMRAEFDRAQPPRDHAR
jgi:hypothetical protein